MKSRIVFFAVILSVFGLSVFSQAPDLPTLQVGGPVKVTLPKEQPAVVIIPPQTSAPFSGTVTITKLDLGCYPYAATDPYPKGVLAFTVDLSDTTIGGKFDVTVTAPIQLTYVGTVAPTAFLSAMCDIQSEKFIKGKLIKGYLWMEISDNHEKSAGKPSEDIVSFVILDPLGKRIAYGTGAVKGKIDVTPIK